MDKYELDVTMLMLNLVMLIFWIKTAVDSAATFIPIIVMPIIFVCHKFDEIDRSMSIAIRRQDRRGILKEIRLHSRLTRLCKRFANINNIVLGLVHMMVPYMAALSIECFKYEAKTILDYAAQVIFKFRGTYKIFFVQGSIHPNIPASIPGYSLSYDIILKQKFTLTATGCILCSEVAQRSIRGGQPII